MNNDRIEKSLGLANWICSSFTLLKPITNGRIEHATVFYYITWQHHTAIAHSCDQSLYAPATALIRCAWDSYTRGLWLELVATETQLADFINSEKIPKPKDISISLEPHLSAMGDDFLNLNANTYSLLCDLNHTGITQIKNHFSDGDIVAELDDKQVDAILNFVEFLSLRALFKAAQLAENPTIENQALIRVEKLKLRLLKKND
jgi:hypothetical protein